VPVSRNAPPDYGGVGESLSAPPYDVEVMAVLLFKCPETGTPVDLGEVSPEAHLALSLWSRPITALTAVTRADEPLADVSGSVRRRGLYPARSSAI